jgi:hypothetical protein
MNKNYKTVAAIPTERIQTTCYTRSKLPGAANPLTANANRYRDASQRLNIYMRYLALLPVLSLHQEPPLQVRTL